MADDMRAYGRLTDARENAWKGGGERDVNVWLVILIPFVSAIVGYGTNVVALRMSFYPIEFTGIKIWQPKGQPFGLFGWQGIVPARAKIMATRLTELFLNRLLDLQLLFSRVDPEIVRQRCHSALQVLTDRLVKETMELVVPSVYDALHEQTKQEIRDVLSGQSAEMVEKMMAETQAKVLDMLNLAVLVGRLAEENKASVVKMFLEVGKKEYRFVELSGLLFGFLFGCIQAVVYYFFERWWVLPVAGILVGWFTNYFALKLIFEPAKPIRICGLSIQGVFLKRQQEAAVSIADMSQSNFLTVDHMMHEIMHGDGRPIFDDILNRMTQQYIRRLLSGIGGFLASVLSPDLPIKIEDTVIAICREEISNILPLAYDHIEQAMDLRETLRVKLQSLPPDEFVGTLRPVFQEDEIKLIAVGAILGMIIGFVQQFLIFHWVS